MKGTQDELRSLRWGHALNIYTFRAAGPWDFITLMINTLHFLAAREAGDRGGTSSLHQI